MANLWKFPFLFLSFLFLVIPATPKKLGRKLWDHSVTQWASSMHAKWIFGNFPDFTSSMNVLLITLSGETNSTRTRPARIRERVWAKEGPVHKISLNPFNNAWTSARCENWFQCEIARTVCASVTPILAVEQEEQIPQLPKIDFKTHGLARIDFLEKVWGVRSWEKRRGRDDTLIVNRRKSSSRERLRQVSHLIRDEGNKGRDNKCKSAKHKCTNLVN